MLITNKTIIKKLFDYNRNWRTIEYLKVEGDSIIAYANHEIFDTLENLAVTIGENEIRILEWENDFECTGGIFVPFEELCAH